MGFHQQVNPGDPVTNSARLENDIRRALGGLNGFMSGGASSYSVQPSVIVGYNASSPHADFKAGQPVRIGDGELSGDAVPFESISEENMTGGYAVLLEDLPQNGYARAVVSGIADTAISAIGEELFVQPTVLSSPESSDWWTLAETGARIIYSGEQGAKILLGGSSGGGEPAYNGYFKLIDVSDFDEEGERLNYKVAVSDGHSFDPETQTSANSLIRTDGTVQEVEYEEFELTSGKVYFELEYVWQTGEVSLQKVASPSVSDDSILHLVVGAATVYGEELFVEQIFKENGIPSLSVQYAGAFKLYRVPNGDGGYTFGVAAGTSQMVSNIPDTAITFSGNYIYLNLSYTPASGTFAAGYSGSSKSNTDSVRYANFLIGSRDNSTVLFQNQTGAVVESRDYIV